MDKKNICLVPPATAGEKLFIHRLRLQKTQPQMAADMRVGVETYRSWENGQREQDIPFIPNLDQLQNFEKLRILRRRSGLFQSQVAAKIGVTRLWVHRMEKGLESTAKLRNFWGV